MLAFFPNFPASTVCRSWAEYHNTPVSTSRFSHMRPLDFAEWSLQTRGKNAEGSGELSRNHSSCFRDDCVPQSGEAAAHQICTILKNSIHREQEQTAKRTSSKLAGFAL